MSTMPKRSPLEIFRMFGKDLEQTLVVDGFTFTMDKSPYPVTVSPPEDWAPVGEDEDGTLWFCSGEPGDPIDERTYWVEG